MHKKTVNNLVKHILENKVQKETFGIFNLGCDPNNNNISREIYESLRKNIDKITKIPNDQYLNKLKNIESKKRDEFEQAFDDSHWKSIVRGRDVLRRIVSEISKEHSKESFSYKTLRNNTISIMATDNHKPEGMKKIIQEILDA